MFCEKNDILVVQMALTYDKCRKILLESLGEKVAIKHIILNASKQTIKDRLKERAAKRGRSEAGTREIELEYCILE